MGGAKVSKLFLLYNNVQTSLKNFYSTPLTVIDWKHFLHQKKKLHFRYIQELSLKYKIYQSSPLLKLFPKMATLRNR